LVTSLNIAVNFPEEAVWCVWLWGKRNMRWVGRLSWDKDYIYYRENFVYLEYGSKIA